MGGVPYTDTERVWGGGYLTLILRECVGGVPYTDTESVCGGGTLH